MREALKVASWTRALGVTLLSLGIFHMFPAQAQQDTPDRAEQSDDAQTHHYKHHHYHLVQIPTLGGPGTNFFDNTNNIAVLNAHGVVSGGASDTLIPDPYLPPYWWSNGNITHAFVWQDGTLTNLGSLPGTNNSGSAWISSNGIIAGLSENGQIDPSVTELPELSAVIWRHGKIVDLGSLPGGGYQSAAVSVNNRGEAVGVATNLVPDSNSLMQYNPNLWQGIPYSYQLRAFIWDQENGMQDLGTLGTGTDAEAIRINERGQVIGNSYISSPPGNCNFEAAGAAFVWDREHGMVDLGGFGGSCTFVNDLNNKGQIVGGSSVTGDTSRRAFLWEHGSLSDLGGSLGGNNAVAIAVNENGEAVGSASLPGETTVHATFWRHVGQMTDLGSIGNDPCAFAQGVNDEGQVVGDSSPSDCKFDTSRAFLWEHGSIVDLNTLIPLNSPLDLLYAYTINNRGEIAVNGRDAKGIEQAALLIPCDENHSDVEGCDYDTIDAGTAAQVRTANRMESPALESPQPGQRSHGIGFGMIKGPFTQIAGVLNVGALTVSALNTYQIKLNWQVASGQQTGFNIYSCHGCSVPRTQGTRIASVGASVLTYTDGSSASPLTQTTAYTYQVAASTAAGESGRSNPASVTTQTELAPTNLTSVAFEDPHRGHHVRLNWSNHSTDDDSILIDICKGSTCTNFLEIVDYPNTTTYTHSVHTYTDEDWTFRYRVRAHSPGGYSVYSNIRTQLLP